MLEFYRNRLGFYVYFEIEGTCAFMRSSHLQGAALALYAGRKDQRLVQPHWFLVVDLPDIWQAVAALLESGVTVGEVHPVPFGLAAMLSDPEGNMIELHQSTPIP